jgi:hypothetical protein
MKQISETQMKILRRAVKRERGNICPIVDGRVHAAAEMAVIHALHRRGLITDARAPYITEAGRQAVAAADGGDNAVRS